MTQGVTLRSTVCRSFTTNLRSAANPQTPLGIASARPLGLGAVTPSTPSRGAGVMTCTWLHRWHDDSLPLGGPSAKWLLCGRLDEMDRTMVEGVPARALLFKFSW